MNEFIDFIKEHYKLILGIIITLFVLSIGYLIYHEVSERQKPNVKTTSLAIKKDVATKVDNTQEEKENTKIKVDIKGAITSPGVYEVPENTIVNELINMAGGLAANGSTKNLNLARKLTDEMVIIIYTEKELEKQNQIAQDCETSDVDISSCYKEKKSVVTTKKGDSKTTEPTNNQSTIISLNNATKEELLTLPGIGEAKAQSIIDYRNTNGEFKAIEEIMNVKGIGESIYNKIKEYLTL